MRYVRQSLLLSFAAGVLCAHAGEKSLLLLPMQDLFARFSVASAITDTNGVTVWTTPDMQVRFFDNSRRLEINGTLLWMNGAVTTNEATQRMIAATDVETVLAPLLAPAAPVARSGRFVVVLDPGHGGDDPGAVATNAFPEKKLTLDIARRVRKKLKVPGVSVRMTRRGDQTLTLAERSAVAARRGDVFVSIHANKAPNVAAEGIETFVLPADGYPSTSATGTVFESHPGNLHDAASTQLAYFIHREMGSKTQAVDRGIKRARFEVLRNSPCPAALVEVGFMSNTGELAKLLDPGYRDRLAEGIASGILAYMRQNRTER